ncbi:MAG: hypothetical protein ACRD0V_20840 [Acidimicrobiales bacterium]
MPRYLLTVAREGSAAADGVVADYRNVIKEMRTRRVVLGGERIEPTSGP